MWLLDDMEPTPRRQQTMTRRTIFEAKKCFQGHEIWVSILSPIWRHTKRSMKVAKELFADYVKEKKLRYFYTFRNKLSVQFIISSLRLRLIIPTSSLINLDIKKTSSNNCLISYYQKPEAYVCFCQTFLKSLNCILTCALILTCKHWDSLICIYLHFFHLYALTFTCMHLHSLVCTYIHLHTLTFTCMHVLHLYALTFTYTHLPSPVCTCRHLYAPRG